MAVDFNKREPWSSIQTVTIDGQEMVRIPKFYIKVGKNKDDKKCWWVSPTPRKGYHIHPAFMHQGQELDQFYIGAYEAYNVGDGTAGSVKDKTPWVSITFNRAQTACDARNKQGGAHLGWHMQNYYERSAVALLCMLEIGTPDVQAKIGAGNTATKGVAAAGSSNAAWRGIHELWGNAWEWCDGLITTNDGKTITILDNKGEGRYVNTGVKLPGVGSVGINDMQDAKGEGFDLSDMLIPKEAAGTSAASAFKEMYYVSTGSDAYRVLLGGSYGSADNAGLTAYYGNYITTSTGGDTSFRIAKW